MMEQQDHFIADLFRQTEQDFSTEQIPVLSRGPVFTSSVWLPIAGMAASWLVLIISLWLFSIPELMLEWATHSVQFCQNNLLEWASNSSSR